MVIYNKLTNNKKFYNKCSMLRKYGMSKLYYSNFHGINSRLDEVQAAILNYKLNKLNYNIKIRRNIAKIYNDNLDKTDLILPTENKDNYLTNLASKDIKNNESNHLSNNNIFCNISY